MSTDWKSTVAVLLSLVALAVLAGTMLSWHPTDSGSDDTPSLRPRASYTGEPAEESNLQPVYPVHPVRAARPAQAPDLTSAASRTVSQTPSSSPTHGGPFWSMILPTVAAARPSHFAPRRNPVGRASEVPFRETVGTQRYGFDTLFPVVSRRTFCVDDYGARADNVTDCTPAFYDALAAARAYGRPAELVFRARGRYCFRPNRLKGSSDLAILNLRNATNLLIRGQGYDTLLVMSDPALGALCVADSDTIMFRDFAVDYDPLPFTQGTVLDVSPTEGSFVLRVHPGYPTPAQIQAAIPGSHSGYRILKAGNGAYRWPAIGGLSIRSVQQVSQADWRFQTDAASLANSLSRGDDFVYVGRRIAQQALGVWDTRAFYLENVIVHASPTCGLGLANVEGASIDGYADTAPAGSNRLLASNADGIFVHGLRGGITVRNSFFMGQGDDCINLHCPAFSGRSVTRVSDMEILLLAHVDVRAGDRLEIMNPAVGKIKGQVGVASATPAGDRQSVRCRLQSPLSALGYDPGTDSIYPVSLSASGFKIVRNYFGQNRSRCLLIQARDGLIQANTFENAEGYGVNLGYGGTAWPEGVIPANVTIRHNIFRNVTGVGLAPAVEASDGSAFRNFRDIVVEENRFDNPRKMAVLLSGCVGARITGNTVVTGEGLRNTWNHPQWYPVDCSVYLENCVGVTLDRFSIRDRNLKEGVIYIGRQCDAGRQGVDVRGVVSDTPAGVPAVKDDRRAL